MGWFSCSHEWYPVGVYHYYDTSYVDSGVESTRITNRCLKCGEVGTESHYGSGFLTLEQLQRAPTRFAQPHTEPKLKVVK